jgi:hypothetical protein
MAIASRSTSNVLSSTHYNELRNLIVKLLGTGVGDYGYGQPTISSTVAGGSTQLVSEIEMQKLRSDILKCWGHQEAPSSILLLEHPTALTDVIRSGSPGDADYQETYNAYIAAINQCETNRHVAHPSQMTFNAAASGTASATDWGNGSVRFRLTLDFGSDDARRWFFNAGGEIRSFISHTYDTSSYPTNSKSYDWNQFLSNKITGTIYNASHYWSMVGGSAHQIQINSSGSPGYVGTAYTANNWKAIGSNDSNGIFYLDQLCEDADQGNTNPLYWQAAYDESVFGTTSTYAGIYYPTGTTTDPLLGGSLTTVLLSEPTVVSMARI